MNQELKQKLIGAGYKGEFCLSELIDACGDRFYGVMRDVFDKGWTAGEYWDYDFFGGEIAYGNTPEEAVANLYIKLNKK
jgi:hypothetical protein